MKFNGAGVSVGDEGRLNGQHRTIRLVMLDGRWRTLAQIEAITGFPQASISAQLRHMRKPRFGGLEVLRRHLGNGIFEYCVKPRDESGQTSLAI